MCECGWFGQKTGQGWYLYRPGDRTRHNSPEMDELLAAWRGENGIRPRHIGAEEILERCLFALINEGGRILDESVAQRASDIDVVYVAGYGFPSLRGGPMHYAEQVGLQHVRDRVAAFSNVDPLGGWTLSRTISDAADHGRFEPA